MYLSESKNSESQEISGNLEGKKDFLGKFSANQITGRPASLPGGRKGAQKSGI